MPDEASSDSLPEDKIELDSEVKLEVEILALAALERIAADIARRLKAQMQPNSARIVLGSTEHLAAIPYYRALRAGLDALMAEADSFLRPAPQELTLEAAAALTTLQTALSGLAGILAFFRAETSFIGRAVTLDPAALRAALAGALAVEEFEVILTEFIPLLASQAREKLLEDLARLRALRAQLGTAVDAVENGSADGQAAPKHDARAAAVAAEIDALLDALHAAEGDKPLPLERALAAADACELLSDDRRTLWLDAKVLTAGGSYKTQKHLFTTLFTGSRLTYSGGAAVSFVVVDGRTSGVVLANVIRDAVGHGRFIDDGFLQKRSNIAEPQSRP
jgi:hypothetical protein